MQQLDNNELQRTSLALRDGASPLNSVFDRHAAGRRVTPAFRLAVAATALAAGCGAGDNTAILGFHPSVRPGMPLLQAIADGERAQRPDIEYQVNAVDCPGDLLQVGRHNGPPRIKIIHAPASPDRRLERGYQEIGYPTREEFVRALPEVLPRFYSCREFAFVFSRYQGWPRTDSFRVSVDYQGKVTTVGPVTVDRAD